MDKAGAKNLQGAVLAALRPLEKQLACSFTSSFITYHSDGSFSLRIKGGLLDPKTGKVADPEASDFATLAPLFGLKPGDLGRCFDFGGHRYRVTGLRPKASKRPVAAERADSHGKYAFSASDVARLLSLSPK